jgi:hypothetical protein
MRTACRWEKLGGWNQRRASPHDQGVMRGHYPMVWKVLSRLRLIGLIKHADGVYGPIVSLRALSRSSADLQPL